MGVIDLNHRLHPSLHVVESKLKFREEKVMNSKPCGPKFDPDPGRIIIKNKRTDVF